MVLLVYMSPQLCMKSDIVLIYSQDNIIYIYYSVCFCGCLKKSYNRIFLLP